MIVLTFCMQEEDKYEPMNGKGHVFTLMVNLLIIVQPRHRSHNIIEHTTLIWYLVSLTIRSYTMLYFIIYVIFYQVKIWKYYNDQTTNVNFVGSAWEVHYIVIWQYLV